MTTHNTPPDGDFANPSDKTSPDASQAEPLAPEDIESGQPFSPETTPVDGVPVLSDAELEQQALAHPGADGDPSTPE